MVNLSVTLINVSVGVYFQDALNFLLTNFPSLSILDALDDNKILCYLIGSIRCFPISVIFTVLIAIAVIITPFSNTCCIIRALSY